MAADAGPGSTGANLIERALLDPDANDGEHEPPTQPAGWDPSLIELVRSTRSRVPQGVEERWGRAQQRANCGLVPEVQHAWVSVDSLLFLWDYNQEDPAVLSVPADSAIISVAVCAPRPGVFEGGVRLVLVLATRLTVSLIGLGFPPGPAPADAALVPCRVPETSGGSGALVLHDWSARAGPACSVRLIPLEGFAAPADGALFHCIRHTADGHIFLLCGAPQVYELAYSSAPGWFHSKCRLVRHSAGWWPWARDFVAAAPSASGRIRLLDSSLPGYLFVGDNANTLRLYRVHSRAGSDGSMVALEELSALLVSELHAQVMSLTKTRLASYTVAHLFPDVSFSGCLHLRAITSAGERLRFACSATPRGGPQSGGGGAEQLYGFRLQHVSQPGPGLRDSIGSGGDGLAAGVARLPTARSSGLEERQEPCMYSAGTWVSAVRHLGAVTTDVHISARVDGYLGKVGALGALECQTVLNFDAPVLDIVEDQHSAHSWPSACGWPLRRGLGRSGGSCSFVILLPHCVQVVRLSCKARSLSRPPSTAAECCSHLMQLTLPPPAAPGSCAPSIAWMWSLDDAQVPSLEEQRHHLLLERAAPPFHLGRWFCGLLQFLAAVLRPVWGACLVAPACERHLLGLYKRRRATCFRLVLEESLVQQLVAQLQPVLCFVREGLPYQASRCGAPSSAAARSQLYSSQRTVQGEAVTKAQQLLRSVVDIVDRVQQVLNLAAILHKCQCVGAVLQSVALADSGPGGLLESTLGDLVATPAALWPAVQLCTVLVAESSRSAVGGGAGALTAAGDICEELHERCPAIFSQVDLSRCVRGRDDGLLASETPMSDYLRRCALRTPSGSPEDVWAVLMQGVRALAEEDMRSASRICVERLQQLQRSDAAAPERARSLLEALLGGLTRESPAEGQAVVEDLLARTRLLSFADDAAATVGRLPFLHGVVLDYLLGNAQLHGVLQSLLTSSVTEIEAFLKDRRGEKRAAGELLWKYHRQHGQSDRAIKVLLQLAESSDHDCGLGERINYLRIAKQLMDDSAPPADEVAETLVLRLEVASRIQVPVHHELRLIADDSRVSAQWREVAEQRHHQLQQLQDLQELYRTALEFGLFHIVLAIVAVSGSEPEAGVVSTMWVSLFFPPAASPYSLAELGTSASTPERALFPLLTRRRSSTFFSQEETAPPRLKAEAGDAAAAACLDPAPEGKEEELLLSARVTVLLDELGRIARPPASFWDVRSIGTVLEYCNCLWFRAHELAGKQAAGAGPWLGEGRAAAGWSAGVVDSAARGGSAVAGEEARAWVALRVLLQAPFSLKLGDVVAFYAEMLAHLDTWVRDLQALLPGEALRCPSVGEEELHLHLCGVTLTALGRWVAQAQESCGSGGHRGHVEAAADFRRAWLRTAEGLLAGLNLRLSGLQGRHAVARRLLPQALRLEAAGRLLCTGGDPGGGGASGGPGEVAALGPVQPLSPRA